MKRQESSASRATNDMVSRALHALEVEARKRPYQTLGTAASIGYLFGQGWLRVIPKLGFAFIAQQAASGGLAGLSSSFERPQRKTIH